MRNKLQPLLSAAVCLILSGHAQAATNPATKMQFSLEAQPLTDAVRNWAKQSELQLIWPTGSVGGVSQLAPEVSGLFSPAEALSMLLAGSELTYSFVDAETVVIREGRGVGIKAVDQVSAQRVTWERGEESPTVQLAQAQGEMQRSSGPSQKTTARDPKAISNAAIAEVVVTGTHLKGAVPAGAPLRTFARQEIEASGAQTIEQFTKQIPQNFGGGVSENTSATFVPADGNTNANHSQGTGFNLRGLGADATLVLLNGHRLSQSGAGNFLDISQIPLAAVSRIDVLTDGASAIYGSDAVAGVVNIVLDNRFDGVETRARYGSVTDGNFSRFGAGQTLGTNWGTGGGFVSYDYSKQDNLYYTDRSFARPPIGDLLPQRTTHSALLSGSQDVGKGVVRLDGLYSQRYTDFIIPRGATSVANTRRLTPSDSYSGALTYELPIADTWGATFAGLYSAAKVDTRQIPILGAPFAVIHSIYDNSLQQYTASIAGDLLELPAGALKATVGVDYRRETFDLYFRPARTTGNLRGNRNVRSIFAEASVPIVSPSNEIRGVNALALSLAARNEDYSDFGGTTNPKVGLAWSPVAALSIRGTYGTSFRAPSFNQSDITSNTTFLLGLPDPTPATQSLALFQAGASPALGPEKARTWTAGIDWHAEPDGGLLLSLGYFQTRYRGRVLTPTNSTFLLANEQVFSPIIIRNPSVAQIAAILADPGAGGFSNLTTSGSPQNATVIVDNRTQNIGISQVKGADLSVHYQAMLGELHWTAQLDATRLIAFENQITPTAAANDIVGTVFSPPKWRARASLGAARDAWTLNLSADHVPGYKNDLVVPNVPIASWTTLDLSVSYTVDGADADWLRNTRIAVSATNVLDRKPPTVDGITTVSVLPIGYDAANASPVGRYLALELRKRF